MTLQIQAATRSMSACGLPPIADFELLTSRRLATVEKQPVEAGVLSGALSPVTLLTLGSYT